MHAFGTTSLVVAILLAVFGTLMYVLLKRKGADVPTDVFLGLAPATKKAN
jgi:hypothetical protein